MAVLVKEKQKTSPSPPPSAAVFELAFEVAARKGKRLLAARAVRDARAALGADSAVVHKLAMRFVVELAGAEKGEESSSNAVVKALVAEAAAEFLGKHAHARVAAAAFASATETSKNLDSLLAAAEVAAVLGGGEAGAAAAAVAAAEAEVPSDAKSVVRRRRN